MRTVDDPAMRAQLARSLAACRADSADLGEIDAMIPAINPGDYDSWWSAWAGLADRVEARAHQAQGLGHDVSVRQGFLRASEYWRQAFFFEREVLDSPRLREGFGRHQACFVQAAARMPGHVESFELAHPGGGRMPGYLFCPGTDGVPRPTIVLPCGFDSTAESAYAFTGYMALNHGYNFVTWEGPGQGSMLYEQGIEMVPQFEHAYLPLLDWLATAEGVDYRQIVVVGRSLGGYLAARGVAMDPEQRALGLVCDPGQYDFSEAFLSERMDRATWKRVLDGDPEVEAALESLLQDPGQARFFRPRMLTLGAASVAEYMRRQAAFTLTGCIDGIACPTLTMDLQGDFASQSRAFHEAVRAPKTLATVDPSEGASGHCGGLGAAVMEATMFDWIDSLTRETPSARTGRT
ncbi:MAG: alpha/beta hydrolase family protein [Halothiobacillaceae bacterium]